MHRQEYIAQLRKNGTNAKDALEAAQFLEANDMLTDYATTNQPDTSGYWDGSSPQVTDEWAFTP